MRPSLVLTGNLLLLLLIYSCKKAELKDLKSPEPITDESTAMRGSGDSKCNFIYATSPWLTDGAQPNYRLFTKEYKHNKLSRITASIQNVVTGGLDSFPLAVKYRFRRMDFVDERPMGQTVAKLRFDHNGNLVTASLGNSSFTFHYFQPITYKLYYSQGRLKEIKYQYDIDPQLCEEYPVLCEEPPMLYPYIKIQYDKHKNISSLSTAEPGSIKYEYDLNKKVKDQFYADEAIHDYYDFWYFLRYLDILPELRPQNLLRRSVFKSNEPEGYLLGLERKYHNQKIQNGRLVSYDVQTKSTYSSSNRLRADESWKVYWDCD